MTEALIKIIGHGFLFERKAYIKDPWNCIDFIIVISGLINKFYEGANLKSLRVIRVIRPLRTFNKIKSLKKVLLAIFSSFIMIKNVFIFMLFYYSLFAIFGLTIFKGALKYQCF